VTAPDPLECLALRTVLNERLCTALESEHCETCQLCPGSCACTPATDWTKGDRVRVTFDAVFLTQPSIKGDRYALVVLPGTDLDGNVLLMDRFRVPLTAMTRHDDQENDRG
jgi:hypothetical protein